MLLLFVVEYFACNVCLASPLVRRQQQLEENVEHFTKTVSDQIAELKNTVSCFTKTSFLKV